MGVGGPTPLNLRLPLSAVVPTRDRPDMLRRSLDSLRASLGPDDELLVVDSASRDAAEVRRNAERVGASVVRCERKGETVARNAGWRAARHDIIAFADDDVWVDEGWAEAFARALSAHPEAAFLTGRIMVPPGQELRERPVSIKDDPEPHVIDRTTRGVLGHAASLAVRRSVLLAVGGFDEALGAGARYPGAPELDLFDRLVAAGHTGRYEPTAIAWHDQWRERADLVRLDYGYGKGAGARLAKLVRSDRARARELARELTWTQGLREAGRNLRTGWQYGALMRLSAVAGTGVGFARAMSETVADGHLARRRPPRG